MLSEVAKVKSFPLDSIKMTGSYCINALAKEIAYLKAFDIDRVLAGFRKNAGIDTRGASPYGGWESLLIGGHAMGHYFTALAQASVNRGVSKSDRKILKKMLDDILSGLAECQLPNGFLWGAQILDESNPEIQFDNAEQGKYHMFKEAWVPWYTMHKILEGLLAAYEIADSAKALEIASKLGDWVYNRTQSWDERAHANVLGNEYGGMNDIMYELYRATGDERYAIAAHAFDEERLFDDILTNRHNVLSGRHANTTIPKIIGAIRRYQTCDGKVIGGESINAERYLEVAKVFWNNVMEHHTYHTGGNSEWEHFREDDSLDEKRTNANCETCNVYNMLKFTKELFKVTGEKKYADYLESAFMNHILASQNPETGMTTYFQSMATGYFKVFSTPWDDFWCCTGSGMENFTKLGDSIFFREENALYVCKYMSCELKADGICVAMNEDIAKSGVVTLDINCDEEIALMLRIPDWAEGMKPVLNGVTANPDNVDGFMKITVKSGDKLVLEMKPKLSVVSLCDNENAIALKYGPWILAAKLGNEEFTTYNGGVAVRFAEKSVSDGKLKINGTVEELKARPEKFVKKVGDLEFELDGEPKLSFIPYYLITERYGIYWRIE